MKYLTFLDYPTLEATGRSFEAQLKQKDKEVESLRNDISELQSQIIYQQRLQESKPASQVTRAEIEEMREEINELRKISQDLAQEAIWRRKQMNKIAGVKGENIHLKDEIALWRSINPDDDK